MNDNFWTPINTVIYKKCMKLAESAMLSEAKARGPFGFNAGSRAHVCHEARYWIDMWENYSKKIISEEQIKAAFLEYNEVMI